MRSTQTDQILDSPGKADLWRAKTLALLVPLEHAKKRENELEQLKARFCNKIVGDFKKVKYLENLCKHIDTSESERRWKEFSGICWNVLNLCFNLVSQNLEVRVSWFPELQHEMFSIEGPGLRPHNRMQVVEDSDVSSCQLDLVVEPCIQARAIKPNGEYGKYRKWVSPYGWSADPVPRTDLQANEDCKDDLATSKSALSALPETTSTRHSSPFADQFRGPAMPDSSAKTSAKRSFGDLRNMVILRGDYVESSNGGKRKIQKMGHGTIDLTSPAKSISEQGVRLHDNDLGSLKQSENQCRDESSKSPADSLKQIDFQSLRAFTNEAPDPNPSNIFAFHRPAELGFLTGSTKSRNWIGKSEDELFFPEHALTDVRADIESKNSPKQITDADEQNGGSDPFTAQSDSRTPKSCNRKGRSP